MGRRVRVHFPGRCSARVVAAHPAPQWQWSSPFSELFQRTAPRGVALFLRPALKIHPIPSSGGPFGSLCNVAQLTFSALPFIPDTRPPD